MRKFNKLFILISIILLSFACISCTPDVNDDISKIREIFKLEQLNMYLDISNEKSEIVSRLKDSVEWSDKLNRDVDYYDLSDIYNLKEIKHLSYMASGYQSFYDYVHDDFVKEIVELVSSVPYVELNESIFLGFEIHIFEEYSKSYCDCGCNNNEYLKVSIHRNKYLVLYIKKDGITSRYVSLIPLDDRLKKVLSEENVWVYIYGRKLE